MTRPDDHLAALFAQDLPPARDPAFSAAVLEALARRRFRRELAVIALASLAAAAALTVLWPVLQPALRALAEGLAPAGLAIAGAALFVVLVSGRLGSVLSFR